VRKDEKNFEKRVKRLEIVEEEAVGRYQRFNVTCFTKLGELSAGQRRGDSLCSFFFEMAI